MCTLPLIFFGSSFRLLLNVCLNCFLCLTFLCGTFSYLVGFNVSLKFVLTKRFIWRTSREKNEVYYHKFIQGENIIVLIKKKNQFLDNGTLEHPAYNPYMAPSNYHLFPALKQNLGCQRFKGNRVVKIVMT